MIIKIIGEEGEDIKSVEHKGVKEFFMFGNKKDEDGILIDYHDWRGGFRYLVGNLFWFLNELQEEKKSKTMAGNKEIDFPKSFVKRGESGKPNLRVLDVADLVPDNKMPDLKILDASNLVPDNKTPEEEEAEEVEKDMNLKPSEGAED